MLHICNYINYLCVLFYNYQIEYIHIIQVHMAYFQILTTY